MLTSSSFWGTAEVFLQTLLDECFQVLEGSPIDILPRPVLGRNDRDLQIGLVRSAGVDDVLAFVDPIGPTIR
jgi:hypothetical protein